MAKKRSVQRVDKDVIPVQVEDRQKVQDELKDEKTRTLECHLSGQRVRRDPCDDRASRGDDKPGEWPCERDDHALPPRRQAHVGGVHVTAWKEVVHRESKAADSATKMPDGERVPGLVDRDRKDLQNGQREKAKDVGPVEGHELKARQPRFSEPENEAEQPEENEHRGSDTREGEPADESIDPIDEAIGIRPPSDVPKHEMFEPHRCKDQRIALCRKSTQLLVKRRRLLTEESIHTHRCRQAREPLHREHARPLEVRDEYFLDRAAAIHEFEQGHVGWVEAQVTACAVIPVRVLEHRVAAATAPLQIRALNVRQWRRHERRVVQAATENLPDVDQRSPPPRAERTPLPFRLPDRPKVT